MLGISRTVACAPFKLFGRLRCRMGRWWLRLGVVGRFCGNLLRRCALASGIVLIVQSSRSFLRCRKYVWVISMRGERALILRICPLLAGSSIQFATVSVLMFCLSALDLETL